MDEFLHERLEELAEIERRVEELQRYREPSNFHELHGAIGSLRLDVRALLLKAQEEYRKF